MLGYICKYAPVEVFTSMGVEMKRIEPDVTSFTQADIKMHPNICSFAKGVLEEVLDNDYEHSQTLRCAQRRTSGQIHLHLRHAPHNKRNGRSSIPNANKKHDKII